VAAHIGQSVQRVLHQCRVAAAGEGNEALRHGTKQRRKCRGEDLQQVKKKKKTKFDSLSLWVLRMCDADASIVELKCACVCVCLEIDSAFTVVLEVSRNALNICV
jgi:hypothetical protein